MRFPVLDGWRGVCALLVALFHLDALGHFHSVGFIRGSYLFVDFFFVLSGFVITHAYTGRLSTGGEAKGFLIRRFGRVWPLHAVMLLAFVPLEIVKALAAGGYASESAAFAGRFAPSAILSNLALVHSLGVENQLTWNMPSWSISAEFFTYVTFAVACLVFRRAMILGAVALAAFGAVMILRFSDNYIDTSFDYGYFRCLYGFFVGSIVHWLHARGRAGGLTALPTAGMGAGAVEIACLIGTVAFVSAAGGNALSFAAPLVFGVVVWVFAFEGGPLSALLRAKPFQLAGAWSYSIYMVHAFVIAVIQKGAAVAQGALGLPMFIERTVDGHTEKMLGAGGPWMMDLLALGYLAAVLAVSALTHRFVETPGQAFFNGLLSWKRKAVAPNPAAEVLDRGLA